MGSLRALSVLTRHMMFFFIVVAIHAFREDMKTRKPAVAPAFVGTILCGNWLYYHYYYYSISIGIC